MLLSEMVERFPSHLQFDWANVKLTTGPCSIETFSECLSSKSRAFAEMLTGPPSFIKMDRSRHSVKVHPESSYSTCPASSSNCRNLEKCKIFQDMLLSREAGEVGYHQFIQHMSVVFKEARSKEMSSRYSLWS